jgi:putative ABC transport system permease protein
MQTFTQDFRYALRLMRRNALFTSIVVTIIAFAIGAATIAYSIIDVWLVRSLPFKDPSQLVNLWRTDPKNPGEPAYFTSWRDYQDWTHNNHSFSEMGGFTWRTQTLKGGLAERVLVQVATPNLFSMMGVSAAKGRTFSSSENGASTAVLSHDLWQRRFGGGEILGQQIILEQTAYTVVGIMPAGFTIPSVAQAEGVDVWVPLAPDDADYKAQPRAPLAIIGRLNPGVSLNTAQAEMAALNQQIDPAQAKMQGVLVVGLQADLARSIRPSLLLLAGAVIMILLIACFNVAGLLTGRALERSKEMSLRTALGAARMRIVRQLLIEAGVLGLVSGAVGVVLSIVGLRYVLSLQPFDLPPANPVSINPRILLFAALVTLLTIVIFGLLPSLAASRVSLNEALKQSSRSSSAGKSSKYARMVLVVSEVCISLLLLAAAGLLGRSFLRLESAPLGFRPEGVLTAKIYAPAERHPDVEAWGRSRDELFRTLKTLPGVGSAGATTHLPLTNASARTVVVDGKPPVPPGQEPAVAPALATPDYFAAMNVPILEGRSFTDADRKDSLNVAILNKAAEKMLFGGQSALSQKIRLADPATSQWFTIVGVVGDTKSYTYNSLEWRVRPEMIFPFAQSETAGFKKEGSDYGMVVVRASGNPAALSRQIRETIAQLEPDTPADLRMMQERVSGMLLQPKLRAVVVGVFGILALLLAASGLYGIMSQNVAQQMREIGTRMALGAQRSNVLGMVLKQGLRVVLLGLAAGIFFSLIFTRLLGSFLYNVNTRDPWVLAAVSFLMLLVGLFSAYFPALRASRLDPITVLHSE